MVDSSDALAIRIGGASLESSQQGIRFPASGVREALATTAALGEHDTS